MAQVIGLFPTPVTIVEGLAPPPLREAILAHARRSAMSGNAHDARLAHTEMVRPEENRDFARLAERLAPHLAAYGELLLGERLKWLVKEIWLNVLKTGGHQAMHNHANSFVSVVVYLTPTDATSRTVFHRQLGGGDFAFVNEHASTRTSPFNARRWATPPMAAGDAILFPSYLMHEVPPNPGPERVTLALNSLPERIDSWGYAVRFQ